MIIGVVSGLFFLCVAFEDQTAEGKEKGFALEKQYVSELLKLGVSFYPQPVVVSIMFTSSFISCNVMLL